MIVRPWQPGDTRKIDIQESQHYMYGLPEMDADLTPLSDAGMAWTGEADGKIIGIAGFTPQWENRALAWALISESAGLHFVKIHSEVKKMLMQSSFRRIEAHVDVGFQPGARWMKMLDFEPEGYMRAFRPDGADMLLYARIRKWHF
jgi:hypothetical protein